MNDNGKILALVDGLFASPAEAEVPSADARYNYKKAKGDADAPKTQDNFT